MGVGAAGFMEAGVEVDQGQAKLGRKATAGGHRVEIVAAGWHW